MDRRKLLKMIMAATGLAMIGGEGFAYELKSQVSLSDTIFNQDDLLLFNEIAEIILPRTDTPGAKDANVGLMALILANDCYTAAQRDTFTNGLRAVDKHSQDKYGKAFLLLSPKQKTEFVQELDIQAKAFNTKQGINWYSAQPYERSAKDAQVQPHYFTLLKQLTIFSFFTSEIGATKVLRFEAIPGKYNGELEYKKGDRGWAT
jgi:hypothetical protein